MFDDDNKIIGWIIGVFILLVVCAIGFNLLLGIGAWGPKKTEVATVTRLYVDISGSGDSRKSHYMIGTDKGVFEVNNSLLLWIWNADEIYAKLLDGKTYTFTTKGNKWACWFIQEYPYVINAELCADK